jgi:glutaredoxin 3
MTVAANIEIYTWSRCPFCIRAKALLDKKGVEYSEYCIDGDEEAREQMTQRANGRRSLPQIFINDRHIGGCDNLYDLESQGELDPLLETSAV